MQIITHFSLQQAKLYSYHISMPTLAKSIFQRMLDLLWLYQSSIATKANIPY